MENREISSNERNVVCIGCSKEIPRDHLGIICPQGHDICNECVPQFVN